MKGSEYFAKILEYYFLGNRVSLRNFKQVNGIIRSFFGKDNTAEKIKNELEQRVKGGQGDTVNGRSPCRR